MEPERSRGGRNPSWSGTGRGESRLPQEEETGDPFADEITPVYSASRERGRSHRRTNTFSNPPPFQATHGDVFDSVCYEDPFVDARARNRAQFACNNPWPTAAAPASTTRNSFASHSFQTKHSGGANAFSDSEPQDVFQANATELASEEAPKFSATHLGAGSSFANNDSSKPPKYPFKNQRNQPASSSGQPQGNQGLAPRKQFTSFGNETGSEEYDEWPAREENIANERSWKANEADEEKRASLYTGERLSLFIRSVPIPLFSTRAMAEHFERLPVTVSNVSLRGSKQKDSNRTAVVTFESVREASLAFKAGRSYHGTILNIQFYQPYEVRKNSRAKEKDELKRVEATHPKLVISQVPRGIRSGRQMKQVLEGFASGVVDVKFTQRHGADGSQRDAIITMWDEDTAEEMLRSRPRYYNKRLHVYHMEEVQTDDGHTGTRNDQVNNAGRAASRKEPRQMTEEERVREMEQLRREIAKIEEKKRQQESRKEKQLSQKLKGRMGPQESYEKVHPNVDRRKVDARLSKYGSLKPSTEPKKTNESTRNEHWRKVGQKMDIQDARQFVGECLEMCPMTESESRVEQRDVSIFELKGGPGSEPDPAKAVKKYRRSAAISEEQKPEEVRPPQVLARTMDHLKKVCDSKQAEFYEVHNFIRDRTRSIRQDFTLQGVRDECCIKIHEESVRFHIMSEHRLFGTNPAQFSSKQNLEQLDKCLISLREMYDFRREQNLRTSENEPEMQAYYILTQMSDPQTCVQLWTGFAKDVRRSLPVKLALEIVKAAGGQFINPVRFFSCVRQAPYLMACLMHSRFTLMRVQALRLLNSAYGSANSQDEIAIDTLTKRLCFEDEEEAQQFCELLGFEVLSSLREEASRQVITPPSRDFDTSRISLFKLARSGVIESKASILSPSEIVEGAASRGPLGYFEASGKLLSGGTHGNKTVTHAESANIGEKASVSSPIRNRNVLGSNALQKQTSTLRVSSIETNVADEVKPRDLFSGEQRLAFNAEAPTKEEPDSSLGLFPSQNDPGSHSLLVAEDGQRKISGATISLRDGAGEAKTSTALIQSTNVSTGIQFSVKQGTSDSSLKGLGQTLSASEKPFHSVQAAMSTQIASSAQSVVGTEKKMAPDGLTNALVTAVPITDFGITQAVGKYSTVEEGRQNESAPQIAGPGSREVLQTGSEIPINEQYNRNSSKTDREPHEDEQNKLRERASRVVEERQRIVSIAKKARAHRHEERCGRLLFEIARHTESIEESMRIAFSVLRSLNEGGLLSRSDTLRACQTGFEHLGRTWARITRAEEFLDESKSWSWEGLPFPELPSPTLSELRKKGGDAWEAIYEHQKTALLRSPEPPNVDEHAEKFFYANKPLVNDLRSPLEMSMKTVTDRIPILSLPSDDRVPNPGLEVENVFLTLRKLAVLQWQAVIVGERKGLSGVNVTTTWLRSRLGKDVMNNRVVINAKNKETVKYPCLSVLQVGTEDTLPSTASTIIWPIDGATGESGLNEQQKVIEQRLSALRSQSRTAANVPPFLILVCFNSMGPISPSLKEKLEQGDESEWAQSLLTRDIVCGVRCVVLSRETVLQRDQDPRLTGYIAESVVCHQSRSVTHRIDFQLQQVGDKLVEVGNNAWMEVLDWQFSRCQSPGCNELYDVIRIVNRNWRRIAKEVSENARRWPTEFSYHRLQFIRVGAELTRRMKLPMPSENNDQSYERYLGSLCTLGGIAFPKIRHDGFQGLVEFCRALGIIMPRLVSSLLRDLNNVEAPLARVIDEEKQTSRIRRLNVLFTSVFAGDNNRYSSDTGDRRKESSLGKRHRHVDDVYRKDVLGQDEFESPVRRRRLSLNEEYRGASETPRKRFSLPWKVFGSRRWSERYEVIVAEAEAFGKEIDATIDLISKRRKVFHPERQLVVSG